MKNLEEITDKFVNAARDLIEGHGGEIERLRDKNGGKITLRFSCAIEKGTLKTRPAFGLPTKDEVSAQLDGDQLPLDGLETPAPKPRRSKKSA
jgi:hypothetical protein